MSYIFLTRRKVVYPFLLILTAFISDITFATEVPISDFSIQPYSQNIEDHIPSNSQDYMTPLLTPAYQAEQLQQFYQHYYSSDTSGLSPWGNQMVSSVLPVVKEVEHTLLDEFNNQTLPASKQHFAENFKAHDSVWLEKIKQNMDLNAIATSEFKEQNKAIAVANTYARALPENAPDFYHFTIPGEGFPFDNLQESVIWAGTPLYVVSVSVDQAWSLVITPDGYFSWVKSNDIAYASSDFIHQWQTAVQNGLVAVTETGTTIFDSQHHFQLTGYIGAVFPLLKAGELTTSIYIPSKNDQQQAVMKTGVISKHSASLMPLSATKQNLVKIIKQLQNRPYGWGGAYFYNDCSQELKSIFTPFGIWLPRNSAAQAKLSPAIDLSEKTMDERIQGLKTKGHPLMTIIYIGGHVMLYIGNKVINQHESEVMTYQNIWGLSPASKDKRYVIGQSLFFPLLKYFPQNQEISSQAQKSFFKLINLDQLDTKKELPQNFAKLYSGRGA